jgi:4'-phosphopantetheinyl transferase
VGDAINCIQVIDGVHIWRAALDDPGWPGPAELPAEERERAGGILREQAARRWVASRWALRRVLAAYLEVMPAAIPLEIGERGKPRLAGGGRPRFNLSHSEGLALVAVAEREVGVDVERIRPQRPAGFYAAWARHEARLKCLGTGFGDPTLRSSSSGAQDRQPVAVEDLEVAPEYAAAVAVAGDEVGPLDCRSLFAG